MPIADNDRSTLYLLPVIAVGVLSLVHDSLRQPAAGSWMNYHALFGALLWGSVVASFYRHVHRTAHMPAIDLRALSRRLSRLVYLVLYILMFFGLAIAGFRAALHRPMTAPVEEFQGYLAWGCASLVTIQALAAVCRHFVTRDDGASAMNLVQRNGRLM
ncbi:MAG: hypothetical protein WBF89_01205 [Steroidobacteraceae bacterium]